MIIFSRWIFNVLLDILLERYKSSGTVNYCSTYSNYYLKCMSDSCDPMKETLASSSISFALILSIVTGGAINASAAPLMSSITTATATTATPIKHLVVIFQENISPVLKSREHVRNSLILYKSSHHNNDITNDPYRQSLYPK